MEYGGRLQNIESVVYTLEETPGYHTFYFSPTKGLVDIEAMQMADDYIKIVAADPSGIVDLLSTEQENELSYQDMTVNSASTDVAAADLMLKLTSSRTVNLDAEIRLSSGKTLRAKYSGFCSKYPANAADEPDAVLDKSIFSYYFGLLDGASAHNYYLVLTDSPFVLDGTNWTLTTAGHALILDLFADLGEDDNWRYLPTGIYETSESMTDHTYTSQNSALFYFDNSGKRIEYTMLSPVEISRDDNGQTTIAVAYLDDTNTERTLIYKNELTMVNGIGGASLPQIQDDVELKSHSAEAFYQGNLLQGNAGLMQINIYDETYATQEGAGGYAVTLYVFHDLFADPSKAAIMPGEYVLGSHFTHSTWMAAQEMSFAGVTMPIGTYAHCDDGTSYGKFSYASAGENIKISDAGMSSDNKPLYKIDFNLISRDGYKIKGSYTGAIPITDVSDDKSQDDGTSTLERDYKMDLDYIVKARLYPNDQIYVTNLGYKPISEYGCGYQIIDIGSPSGKDGDEGDIMRIELLVEPGAEQTITPGEYMVTTDRYPASFKPGVCVRGHILADEGVTGTRWMHFEEGKYIVMDGHACIYGGSIVVSDAGNGNFTFEIKGTCVRKHNVTGTWTGPVVNGWSDQPIGVTPQVPMRTSSRKIQIPGRLGSSFILPHYVDKSRLIGSDGLR